MSLLFWLPLNGNRENYGLNPAVFTTLNGTSGLEINSAGKIGSCYRRTASTTSRLRSDSTVNLNKDLSMTCWLYIDSLITNDSKAYGIITNHSHSSSTGVGLTIKQLSDNDYRISCNTGDGTNRTFNTYYGESINLKGAWHHVGLTYNKNKKILQLWVDGKVDYTLADYNNASKEDYIDLFGWSTAHITE